MRYKRLARQVSFFYNKNMKHRFYERYHTSGQALDPEPLIRLPFRGKPRGIKPCFPCAHSGMNKFTPLIPLGNKTKELAVRFSVHPNTIRFYAEHYLSPIPRNPVNNYRIFQKNISRKFIFSAACF